MTALNEYRRLEALGLWREQAQDQRREVVVSLGEATLVMSSASGTALGHWSLPAVERLNPGKSPALYAPASDSDEELEIADADMVDAIERIRAAIAKSRPRPGRLRLALGVGFTVAAMTLGVFWLPGALTRQTVSLLPEAKRVEIGEQLLVQMTNIAGRPCTGRGGRTALLRLSVRTFGTENAPQLVIFPATIPDTLSLPGNIIAASAALAEDFETPEVLAGYLLAEATRRATRDPLETFLSEAGLGVTFRLLTTGEITEEAIHAHAARLLSRDAVPVDTGALLARFEAAEISSQPYAFARDVSGESVLGLIEADPMRGGGAPVVLNDADWVSLQEICAS
ncbi:hypothetical protein KUL25_08620 [Rhodobacteraceae bacterium N5(2021)]|uniref:Uncharacterized protein n=1 Tax=Gymnodinialimonas phycosphaerae TaxID=2841589 RepID=A0A975TZB3_9RHOB|nr:hypothetical protein [Gymnodinialimonas phycosphaerae]MBY4892826.1 hypothetical protein [Gymnodinialimonas phycosphaerae]